MENEVTTVDNVNNNGKEKSSISIWGKVFISLFCIFLISVLSYYFFILPRDRKLANDEAYKKSLAGKNPAELQNIFLNDIKDGKNDEYTKSAAYFIGHRYFDNGGNVYEIADYIKAHEELAFLKEANAIYPKRFKKLEEGGISKTYSDDGMYILLAWLEILDNHGYSDVAMTATIASQYAKLAYFMQRLSKDFSLPSSYAGRLADVDRDIKKAVLYEEKASLQIKDFFDNKISEKDVMPRDILVGLNQYAAAQRYLEVMNKNIASPKNPDEIFDYSLRYSAEKVPELYVFTSLVNASTLMLLPASDNEKIAKAIKPFLDFANTFKGAKDFIVMSKILKSRSESFTMNNMDYDIYGKVNAVLLASKVPEFKSWLMNNGWVESDFVLPGQQ